MKTGLYQGKNKVANSVKSLKRRLRSNSQPKKEQIDTSKGDKFTWYIRGNKIATFKAEALTVERKTKTLKSGVKKGGGSIVLHKLIQL
jgi:hypothetical protein